MFQIFRFYPIDKSVYKKPYDPLMVTKSKYGALDYGSKYFREEAKQHELTGGVSLMYFFLII